MADNKTAYLDQQQRHWIKQQQARWLWRSEFPTWLLIITVYGGWFGSFIFADVLGRWLTTALLIWFTAWYMSLQHELIHGHPTRYPRFNQLLGLLPLAVWYPYGLYRDSHLAHHRNELLTYPQDDPETYYFSHQRWQSFGPLRRGIIRLRNTFPGRLLVGPLIDIAATARQLLRDFWHLRWAAMLMWTVHVLLLAGVFYWITRHGMSVGYYLLVISYPALALTKVRSFYEHRADENPAARSVINEAGAGWRLLFLNLNYHSVHHDLPGIPWYALRSLYLQNRNIYQQRNQGFVVKGYRYWLRHFLTTPLEVELHPAEQEHQRD